MVFNWNAFFLYENKSKSVRFSPIPPHSDTHSKLRNTSCLCKTKYFDGFEVDQNLPSIYLPKMKDWNKNHMLQPAMWGHVTFNLLCFVLAQSTTSCKAAGVRKAVTTRWYQLATCSHSNMCNELLCSPSSYDPSGGSRFPTGGGPGAKTLFWPIFRESCMKMKKKLDEERGHVPRTP